MDILKEEITKHRVEIWAYCLMDNGKLLIHAFEYAKKEGFQVVPSCPFIVGDFLKRFPKYQEIVRAGEFPFFEGESV